MIDRIHEVAWEAKANAAGDDDDKDTDGDDSGDSGGDSNSPYTDSGHDSQRESSDETDSDESAHQQQQPQQQQQQQQPRQLAPPHSERKLQREPGVELAAQTLIGAGDWAPTPDKAKHWWPSSKPAVSSSSGLRPHSLRAMAGSE